MWLHSLKILQITWFESKSNIFGCTVWNLCFCGKWFLINRWNRSLQIKQNLQYYNKINWGKSYYLISTTYTESNEIDQAAPNSFLWKALKLKYLYRIAAYLSVSSASLKCVNKWKCIDQKNNTVINSTWRHKIRSKSRWIGIYCHLFLQLSEIN